MKLDNAQAWKFQWDTECGAKNDSAVGLDAYANLVRVTVINLCVWVSVTSLTATLLTYGYNVRLKANVLLTVFDLWISLNILRSKCLTTTKFEFQQAVGTPEDYLMTIGDYW